MSSDKASKLKSSNKASKLKSNPNKLWQAKKS